MNGFVKKDRQLLQKREESDMYDVFRVLIFLALLVFFEPVMFYLFSISYCLWGNHLGLIKCELVSPVIVKEK